MDTLLFAINAIMPIIFLILLGYFLKRTSFLDEQWFKKGNKIIFRVCLPAMLFINVYNIGSFSKINWIAVWYSEIVITILFLIGIVFVKYAIPDDRQKGPILQCIFRSNYAIIGIPLAESLGGAEAVSIAAVLSALLIPTINIYATIALTMFQNGGKADVKSTIKSVVKNPLIMGVLAGFIALAVRSIMPVGADNLPVFTIKDDLLFLYKAIENLAKIASPLALIILGGLFEFSAIKGMKRQIIIGTTTRVLVVPLLALGMSILLTKHTDFFCVDSVAYPALLALFGSPVAVSSAIMAQEMDNDGVLAGQLVVWTSIASMFTLFLFIFALRTLGYL